MYRVQKLLSKYGYCSRRKGEELIKAGRVKVNKQVIQIGDKATEKDKIYVDDKPVQKNDLIYIMFHKPVGCVTSLDDKHNRTIMEYLDLKQRVFPVGRLDYNTSGLLILTNDGDFANKIMHPRYEVEKRYQAEINKPITPKAISLMRKGVKLEEYTTKPVKVWEVEPKLIEITIHEGKKRIVRLMLKELGYKTLALKRIKIGRLELRDLPPGQYRKLKKKELDLFLH